MFWYNYMDIVRKLKDGRKKSEKLGIHKQKTY